MRCLLTGLIVAASLLPAWKSAFGDDVPERRKYYHEQIRPVLAEHCFSCHNEADKKGGINLEDVYFVSSIIRNGSVWSKVTDLIASGEMPPRQKPRLTEEEKDVVIEGINGFLMEALAVPDPGLVTMRRLSHREYRYSVLDLLGVDFDTRSFFPADGSGGEGFDNHARVLYITTLSFERYYEAAELIVQRAFEDEGMWRRIVPRPYERGVLEQLAIWWHRIWHGEDISLRGPVRAAEEILHPLAARAYRRFPDQSEIEKLTDVFSKVYVSLKGEPDRFDRSIRESLKAMLISPHFLYRHEVDLPLDRPYPISGFEMASRLAYFLWSSIPDQELMNLAYRGDLQDPDVLEEQVRRMLVDPRSRRFAESFATQWLGVDKILDTHEVDADKFPEVTDELRRAMYDEVVDFFHHVLTERRSFLDLLDSDYTFLNETLAGHYGMEAPIPAGGDAEMRLLTVSQGAVAETAAEGGDLVKVALADRRRGGVLGMGGVLMATSFPHRTSPVVRGKWVVEQILGARVPPPPPDVPEIEEAEHVEDELDLREILSRHASAEACAGCHVKMDPIGLGLENFDAIGRWRDGYGERPIDASGVLADGTAFDGPVELKQILLDKKDEFARNLSQKMLGYALGRDVQFVDTPTIDKLTDHLLENDFHTVDFITEVVTSFPFRYKKSDPIESDPIES